MLLTTKCLLGQNTGVEKTKCTYCKHFVQHDIYFVVFVVVVSLKNAEYSYNKCLLILYYIFTMQKHVYTQKVNQMIVPNDQMIN